ncbi:MAG: SpoIIE family protein phosphatase, partial [Chlorobiales bacterium]|nr:SpoIIE family protein phosphatase [Chlorobiales bacterium]
EHAMPEAMEQIKLKYDSMEALEIAFQKGRRFIGMRELNEESFEQGELIHATLMRLGADICLPMKVERGILGYILLGKKRSEASYNLEELELLTLLADQAALGIEHMNLAQDAAEKEKFRRELEIGRKMQQSLLPTTIPFLPGLEIAALNVPAMEVGGDFYTFVEYNQQKLGVIAGDIVGKGVAGALNMAATISSLRLIAEESASVSEAMQRLNRYLVKNSDKRSFAAVVVAMVELDKKILRWSNGGLPDPIMIPARGNAVFLEAERYPLPPGASAHSAYTELQQKLKAGDTIVLVSDGAIEVCPNDGSDEVYGYQRLLQFLSENRKRELTDLLEALSREIREYSGSDQLGDDFTVVAFRVGKLK